jgi:sodium transport system permease protein
MITALATQWNVDNRYAIGALMARIGFESAGGLKDMARLSARAEELKRQPEHEVSGDAATRASWKALRTLGETERDLLSDMDAVSHLMTLTQWVDLAEVRGPDRLPPGVKIPDDLPPRMAAAAVAGAITSKDKAVHAAVDVPDDYDTRLEQGALSVPITVLYDASQSLSKEAYDRLDAFVGALSRAQLRVRLDEHQLKAGFIKPFDLKPANLASDSREIQAVVGGFLPYLIILFCFFGAFYPSLDLTAGEKERFTLETLLLAPVSRLEIAAGKFVVVFFAAVTAAVLTTASMAITFTHGILPKGTAEAFNLEFQPLALVLAGSLIVPVAALFSAMLLGVALFARSFKEAQSYAAPLQFLIIAPAVASLMPDLETEIKWAWVPLMNVSLLMKELLKGNYLWEFYTITLISMLVLTGVVVWLSSLMFRRESVLMRT